MSGIDLASSDETKQKVALKEAIKIVLGGAADPDGAAKLSRTPTVDHVRAGGALRRAVVYRLYEALHILS